MQMAKDTALMTWAERLRTINPARKAAVDGVERPAVMAMENERPELHQLDGIFWVSWGKVKQIGQGSNALHEMHCTITYPSAGTQEMHGCDRGREVTRMDAELRSMLRAAVVPKMDYTQSPPIEAGTFVTWSAPQFGDVEQDGAMLKHSAQLDLYFYPEGSAA